MAAQRIGVLGTGPVGRAISGRLVELGHDVLVGSRTASSDVVRTFAEAAAHGDVVVNATGGIVSIEALTAAGAGNLAGKPLVDISNALDHSAGFPPKVLATDSESLGERIQAAFPEALVVKTLNTMTNAIMVRPRALPGPHTNFLAGNDDGAKAVVRGLLLEFGWTDEELVDLGDLSGSRGMELYLPLWLRTYGAVGHGMFNVHVVRAAHA
ncbi:MAG TPA: NAD(P)-binding domain-containing protein [Actinomycetes bacterium]